MACCYRSLLLVLLLGLLGPGCASDPAVVSRDDQSLCGTSEPVGSANAVLATLADFPAVRERRRTDLARLLALASELLDERGIEVWAVPFDTPDVAYLHELTRSSGGEVVPLQQLDAVFGVRHPKADSPQQVL